MKKFCVYTAIVGGYDEIKQPLVIDEDFDFILFSDDAKDSRIGVWEVKSLDYDNVIRTKTARYVKTHPELLCKGYETCVWIDASVKILSKTFYEQVKSFYKEGVAIASLVHPDWTCTYQELFQIMYLGWESEFVTLEWGNFLRGKSFPRGIGTFETRVLYRNHSNENIRLLDGLWWECIEHYSRRDQYSFRYCLWKLNVECVGFLPANYNAHNNEFFVVENHRKDAINSKVVGDSTKSWLMRYYMKHADERQRIENAYYWIYGRKHYMLWLKIIGQCYRVKHLILRLFGRKEVYPWEVEGK